MKIVLAIVVVLAALLGFIASRPGTYHVERSITVQAAPQVVFDKVNNLKSFATWSPWENLDPGMKKEYSGPEMGTGASYFWSGNDKVGEGRMTISESEPTSKVGFKLEFLKPFKSESRADLVFVPEGPGTKVTWSMDGTNNFISKAFTLFMNMDKMIGADFEKGLGQLKVVSEAAATAATAAPATGEAAAAGAGAGQKTAPGAATQPSGH